MKKFLSILLALATLVSLVACGDAGKESKGNTYRDVVEEAMKALEERSEEKFAKLISDALTEEYAEILAEDCVDEFEYYEIKKMKGWEISDNYEYDEYDLEKYVNEIEESFDGLREVYDEDDIEDMGINNNYKVSNIKGYVELEITAEVEDENGDEYELLFEFELVKEGSTWKIINMYIY